MPFSYKRGAGDRSLSVTTRPKPRWALLLVDGVVIASLIGALWISFLSWLAYDSWGSTPRWFRLLLVWAVAIIAFAYRKRYSR